MANSNPLSASKTVVSKVDKSNNKRPRGRPPKVPTIDELPDVMRVEHVMRFLQIGRNQCYEAIRTGTIPAVHVGRSIRILKRALLAAMGDPLTTVQAGDLDGSDSDPQTPRYESHSQILRSTVG